LPAGYILQKKPISNKTKEGEKEEMKKKKIRVGIRSCHQIKIRIRRVPPCP